MLLGKCGISTSRLCVSLSLVVAGMTLFQWQTSRFDLCFSMIWTLNPPPHPTPPLSAPPGLGDALLRSRSKAVSVWGGGKVRRSAGGGTLSCCLHSARSHQAGLSFPLTDRDKPFSGTTSGFLQNPWLAPESIFAFKNRLSLRYLYSRHTHSPPLS